VLDLVCYYADLGRPYLPLIERMTQSAKAVMPEARTVLLTPNAGPEYQALFDETRLVGGPPDHKTLCLSRSQAMWSWALQTDRNAVFVDPDIAFQRPIDFFDRGLADIGLLWRKGKPDQPINTGLVLTRPGLEAFWKRYANVVSNLPEAVHYWWCDQLGFALLTGVCHDAGMFIDIGDGVTGDRLAGAYLLDMAHYCPKSDQPHPGAWAIHFKGDRKGPGWEQVFKKSGAGRSSPASVSSTATATGPN
jgi:hypothetical protein